MNFCDEQRVYKESAGAAATLIGQSGEKARAVAGG